MCRFFFCLFLVVSLGLSTEAQVPDFADQRKIENVQWKQAADAELNVVVRQALLRGAPIRRLGAGLEIDEEYFKKKSIEAMYAYCEVLSLEYRLNKSETEKLILAAKLDIASAFHRLQGVDKVEERSQHQMFIVTEVANARMLGEDHSLCRKVLARMRPKISSR